MHTVVIPVDASSYGVEETIEYIDSLQGDRRAIVVHVRADIDVIGSDGGRVSVDADELEIPETVDNLIGALEDRGVTTERIVRGGDVVEQTLAVADEFEADQLVVPTQKRSAVGKFVFGSTTVDFVQNASVPVTLITE